jgi:hypothetical protein
MSAEDFDILMDGSAVRNDLPVLELPLDYSATDAADALEALFATDPTMNRVVVLVGDYVAGVSSRDHLRRIGSAVLRSLGEGDRATLPGESMRYRILRFRCSNCGAVRQRVHLDTRSVPLCPNGHGAMELQR